MCSFFSKIRNKITGKSVLPISIPTELPKIDLLKIKTIDDAINAIPNTPPPQFSQLIKKLNQKFHQEHLLELISQNL